MRGSSEEALQTEEDERKGEAADSVVIGADFHPKTYEGVTQKRYGAPLKERERWKDGCCRVKSSAPSPPQQH